MLVVRHDRRIVHVSRIRPLRFADPANNPGSSGDSHTSNLPCAHVLRPHAPRELSLAEGNGPFKTHRPTCRGAVQSNPSLAHRRGVQDFSRLTTPSPRRRPKNALQNVELNISDCRNAGFGRHRQRKQMPLRELPKMPAALHADRSGEMPPHSPCYAWKIPEASAARRRDPRKLHTSRPAPRRPNGKFAERTHPHASTPAPPFAD